jgi:DNA-binding Lrp family transcriptional regulator
MKDLERRLISELVKNCKRSDRELAKLLGVSQPTVTRTLHRLEKEGYIKEYTAIPDFSKLGYELMCFTFVKMKESLSSEKQKEIEEFLSRFAKEHPHAELIAVQGIGLNKDFAFVTFFKNFADYWETQRLSREVPYSDVNSFESFLVDLKDPNLFKTLSMSAIAKNILTDEKDILT